MEAIDAVITWVDGADPNYQMKYRKYLAGRSNAKKQLEEYEDYSWDIL